MSKRSLTPKTGKNGRKCHPVLKNPLILTVCITLTVLILFGSVLGAVIGVRNSRALASLGGTRLDRSAAAYLATTYKTTFIRYLMNSGHTDAADTPEFWGSTDGEGNGYADMLRTETEKYIRQTVAGAALFDRYFTLNADDKRVIKETAEDMLANIAGGNEKKFDELASPMGFDFDGFVDAITLLYKSEQVRLRLYGADGSTLRADAYTTEREKYFAEFAYVKLLFIRTTYEYEVDENGEYLRDADGNFVKRPLTAEERAEREADVTTMNRAFGDLKQGVVDSLDEVLLTTMLAKYDFDDYTLTGYFFAPASTYTQGFMTEVSREVVERALSLGVGEGCVSETEYGTCFIYRDEPIARAYDSDTFELFFTDFYSDAADYLYLDAVASLAEEVELKDNFFERVDVVALPHNWEIVLRSGFGG